MRFVDKRAKYRMSDPILTLPRPTSIVLSPHHWLRRSNIFLLANRTKIRCCRSPEAFSLGRPTAARSHRYKRPVEAVDLAAVRAEADTPAEAAAEAEAAELVAGVAGWSFGLTGEGVGSDR